MIRAFEAPSPTTGVAWRDDRTRRRLSAIRRTDGRKCLPHRWFRDGNSLIAPRFEFLTYGEIAGGLQSTERKSLCPRAGNSGRCVDLDSGLEVSREAC
jgi:hypothetical protein